MTSVKATFDRILEWVVIVLISSLALLVVAGFTFRRFGAPLVWYDEVAPIMLVWLTYYGAALAALRRAHIGFPKIAQGLPSGLRYLALAFRETCVIGFFLVAAWAGWRVLVVLEGTALISLAWVPAQLTQSVIPTGALLFVAAELLTIPERLQEIAKP